MSVLDKLLKRIQAATGPDREIDLLIGGLWPKPRPFSMSVDQQRGRLPPVLAFTASLDAGLGLVEKVLPGWSWNIGRFPSVRAQLAEPIETEYGPAIGQRANESAATPPLAILAALIRALIAVEQQP